MKKARVLSLITAAVMTVSLFAGCGSKEASTASTGTASASASASQAPVSTEVKAEKVTLNFWNLYGDDPTTDSAALDMQGAVKEWNDKNGTEIEIVALANANSEKQLTAIAAGEGPDIGQSEWVNAPIWGKEGAMESLNKYIDADAAFDKNDFVKGAWNQGQYRGQQYIIPFKAMSMIMFYNKDILKEAGFEKGPETIEELVDMAIKTTTFDAKGNITRLGLKIDFPWRDDVAWPIAFGAKWVDEKGNLTFNTPEMIAAYQWMADYNKKIGVDKMNKFQAGFGEGKNGPFESGKLVFMLNGDWTFNGLKTNAPDLNYGVCFAPPPASGKATLSGTGLISMNGWYINAKSKYKDQAWKFISFMSGKDNMAKLGNKEKPDITSRISSLTLMANNPNALPMQAELAKMMAADKCQGFPTIPYLNEYLGEVYNQMTPAIEGKTEVAKAAEAVQNAMAKKATIESIGN